MLHDISPILIRLYSDGELSPEQAAELERQLKAHPEARGSIAAQVQFERNLRDRVREAFKDETVAPPADLVDRIRAMAIRDDEAVAGAAGPTRERTAVDRRVEAHPRTKRAAGRAASRLGRLFAADPRPNLLAIAAVVMLIAGAVLIGIYGRQIDDQRVRLPESWVAEAAVFADSEHRHFAGDPQDRDRQMDLRSTEEAARKLSNVLDANVTVPDLRAAGYEFCGGGICNLPGAKQSAHLMYRKIVNPGEKAPMVSIYVARDNGQFECKSGCLHRGEWYSCSENLTCSKKCILEVFRSSDGTLVYFLVCCSADDLPGLKLVAGKGLQE